MDSRQKANAMRRRSTALFMSDPTMARPKQRLQQLQTPDENSPSMHSAGSSGAAKLFGTQSRKAASDSKPKAMDEKVMQQLRGIFAAHDEDKDLKLNQTQLAEAIQALGFSPSDELLARFMQRRSERRGRLIDLPTFLLVAGEELAKERQQSGDMIELFELFDEQKTGMVTLRDVRHILHETLTPERLSQAELEEFLVYAGILKQDRGQRRGIQDKLIDYNALLDKLCLF